MKNNFDNIAIIIPALNPNEILLSIIKDLKKEDFSNVIIINDGSCSECKDIFIKAKEEFNIEVYEHSENRGKGSAIKTGLSKIIDNKKICGIITVDADGQHVAKDVRKIAEKLLASEKIVLGERNLLKNKNVPFSSKVGNFFSSIYLKITTGVYLEDTQTGLRGIPRKYFKLLSETKGDRFDYEMNFVKQICSEKIEFDVIDIETIYEKRIKNFRIFKDSYIIYREFFKNIISSLISATIDVALFWIFSSQKISIFFSNILARIISGIFDFSINKKWVFNTNSSQNIIREFYKYFILFFVQMMLNSIIISALSKMFLEHILVIKIIINIVFYVANFFIKEKFIFIRKK